MLVASPISKLFERLELASLFTDAPNDEERANLKVQTDKFGGSVIPAYYVVDSASGKVLAEQTGACSIEEFAAFLERGLGKK